MQETYFRHATSYGSKYTPNSLTEIACYLKIDIERLEQKIDIYNNNAPQKLDLNVYFCRTNIFKNSIAKIVR
jgi:hypothetical protein